VVRRGRVAERVLVARVDQLRVLVGWDAGQRRGSVRFWSRGGGGLVDVCFCTGGGVVVGGARYGGPSASYPGTRGALLISGWRRMSLRKSGSFSRRTPSGPDWSMNVLMDARFSRWRWRQCSVSAADDEAKNNLSQLFLQTTRLSPALRHFSLHK